MVRIGFIGLGRMGSGMVQKLAESGHEVVVYNRSLDKVKRFAKRKNVFASSSLEDFFSKLPKQRIVWVMIKAGKPVDDLIKQLSSYFHKGDILIDGGNSYFLDSKRRYVSLKKRGISFLDCGVSGGVKGAREGACMMVGGDERSFKVVESLFRCMCVPNGYGYMGRSGAGHFVKGIHNGIEYGMMGAINEGMKAIEKHKKLFDTNLSTVAKVYAHGSIIEGRLMSWLYDSFKQKGYLDKISCVVPKGETEDEMARLEKLAPLPVLHAARKMRVDSRKGKVCGNYIAAMRNQFGGHKVNEK